MQYLVAILSLVVSTAAWSCEERVVGHVTTTEDLAVIGARVEIGQHVAVTADDGRFVLHGVCAGTHIVHVHHVELMPWSSSITIPTDHLDIVLEPDLQVVVVTAPSESSRDAHSRTVIEGEALERNRGQDLGEVLEGVPGVTLLRTGSDATRPMVRGFYGRRLLLLRDGMRHESQKWGAGHAPEVDPFAAGSISVVRGAAGVRYGPDAIGGVILMESPALRTEGGVGGRIDLVTASNGAKGIAGAQLDWSDGNGLSARLQGNYADSAALTAPDHVLGNTASRIGNAAATLGWNNDAFDLELGLLHHAFLAGVCYCTRASSPDELRAILANGRPLGAELWKADRDIGRPYQQVTHDTLYGRVSRYVGFGTLDVRYNTQINRRREYKVVREDITGPQFDFTLYTHTLDGALTHDRIHLGSVTSEGVLGATATFQENQFSGFRLVPNHRAYRFGTFAIERMSLGHLLVEAGARFDHQTRRTYLTELAYDRHALRGTIQEVACDRPGDATRCRNAWTTGSVSLGGVWHDPGHRVELRMDLSSASRFPDGDELYLNGYAPSQPVFGLGNPGLRAETTWSASPTVTLDLPWLRAEIGAYANRVDDYIVFGPELTPSGDPAIDTTIQGAYLRYAFTQTNAVQWGVEGQVDLPLGDVFSASLAGSSVRAQERGTGAFLPFIPPDHGSVTIAARPTGLGTFDGTRLAVTALHIARQNRTSEATDLVEPPDAVTRVDANLDVPLDLTDRELLLGLAVTNLFDTRIRTYTSLLRPFSDEPGRDVRVRASMTF